MKLSEIRSTGILNRLATTQCAISCASTDSPRNTPNAPATTNRAAPIPGTELATTGANCTVMNARKSSQLGET